VNEDVLMSTDHSLRRKTGMQSSKLSAERQNMLKTWTKQKKSKSFLM